MDGQNTINEVYSGMIEEYVLCNLLLCHGWLQHRTRLTQTIFASRFSSMKVEKELKSCIL